MHSDVLEQSCFSKSQGQGISLYKWFLEIEAVDSGVQITAWMNQEGHFHCCGVGVVVHTMKMIIRRKKE